MNRAILPTGNYNPAFTDLETAFVPPAERPLPPLPAPLPLPDFPAISVLFLFVYE